MTHMSVNVGKKIMSQHAAAMNQWTLRSLMTACSAPILTVDQFS